MIYDWINSITEDQLLSSHNFQVTHFDPGHYRVTKHRNKLSRTRIDLCTILKCEKIKFLQNFIHDHTHKLNKQNSGCFKMRKIKNIQIFFNVPEESLNK